MLWVSLSCYRFWFYTTVPVCFKYLKNALLPGLTFLLLYFPLMERILDDRKDTVNHTTQSQIWKQGMWDGGGWWHSCISCRYPGRKPHMDPLHRRDSHQDHLISKSTDSNIAAAERITSRTKYEWPATSQCHCQWLLGPTLTINILQAS